MSDTIIGDESERGVSGGQRKRVNLGMEIVAVPVTLFLDEPTTGVDAVSRKEFWELLKNLKQQGITILVSTPYMDEAAMCDRVGLIQNGNLMQVSTPEGLKTSFGKTLLAVKGDNMLKLTEMFSALPDVEAIYPFGEVHHVVLRKGISEIKIPEGIHVKTIEPDVEDCFISLMKTHAG